MYMANARNLHLGPNATYIPLTGIGGWRRGLASGVTQILALGNAKIYQHVGILCVR